MMFTRLQEKVEQHLEPHKEIIRQKVREVSEKAGIKLREAAQNEQTMRTVFHKAHASLPFFLRYAIKEQKFVEFCMTHRERFLSNDQTGEQPGQGDTPKNLNTDRNPE